MKLRGRRLGRLGAALRGSFRQGTAGGPATAAGALGGAPAAARRAARLAPGAFATARLAGDASAAGPLSWLEAATRATTGAGATRATAGPGSAGTATRPGARAGAQPSEGSAAPPDKNNRKRTLATLALGLLAIATAVGSGADFSARTANPRNTFSAGALSMENSKDGTAILNATDLKPGAEPKSGVVDIKNTGSIDGAFTLTRDQLTSTDSGNDNPTPFATKVVIGIVDCGKFTTQTTAYGTEPVTPTCGDADDTTLSLGPLANENDAIALGTYQPGEKHRYQFTGSLASTAGNEYQNDSASARYVFDATQTQ